MNTKNIFKLFFLAISMVINLQADGVGGLVEKLFEILESRHREILSVEESITHNRSEMEREALVRILEGKIREFLRKDKQVYAVLEQIQSSKDSEKALLYQSSMNRLSRFRQTIDEIQNLYFTRPLVLAPPMEVQTGSGNFGTFLNSWEKDTAPRNYEKSTSRAIIQPADKNYHEHLMNEDLKDKPPADSYQNFLSKLNPLPSGRREHLPEKDQTSLDQYHARLTRDSKTPYQFPQKDGSFQTFYDNLQNSFHDEREVKKSQVDLPASTSPFDVPADYYTKLDSPEPKKPLDMLMDDLDRLRNIKTEGTAKDSNPRNSRSFRRFFDQLELSKQQKETIMNEVGSDLHSQDALNDIANKVRKENRVEAPSGADENGEVKQSFQDFHKALIEPGKISDDPGIYQSDPGTTRNKGDFQSFLAGIPESKEPLTNTTPEGFSNDWIGSDVNAGSGPASKNRFRAILNVLKKDNEIAAMEREFVDPDEKKFETELRSVFKEKRVEASKTKSILVPVEGPRFDSFPGNIVQANPMEERLTQRGPEMVQSYPTNQTARAEQLSAGSLNAPLGSPLPSNSAIQSEQTFSSVTSDNSPHEDYSGLLPEVKMRAARAAEARILSRGATLIPIEVETRDIKDRAFPDIDITFEVELAPKNFLAGHILESYEDDAWKKTVTTGPDGTARIHLLLDLQEQEVNISRKIESTKEKTVCKILITPRI